MTGTNTRRGLRSSPASFSVYRIGIKHVKPSCLRKSLTIISCLLKVRTTVHICSIYCIFFPSSDRAKPHQKQFNILTIKDIGSLTPSAGELKARRLYRNRLSITGAKLHIFIDMTKKNGSKYIFIRKKLIFANNTWRDNPTR